MRVIYVEDCPGCGCAMVQENATPAPPALLAGADCADHTCPCHKLLGERAPH